MKQSLLIAATLLSLTSLSSAANLSSTGALSLSRSGSDTGAQNLGEVTLSVSKLNDKATPYSLKLSSAIFTSVTRQKAVVVSYSVETAKDTLSFTFTQPGEFGGEYRVISSKGAAYPGTVVHDTLSLSSSFLCENCCGIEGEMLQTTSRYAVATERSTDSKKGLNLTVMDLNFLGEKSLHASASVATRAVSGTDTARKFAGTIVSDVCRTGMSLTVPFDGEYNVSLMSANGRVLQKKSVDLTADTTSKLGIAIASAGIYLVEVSGHGIHVTERVTLK